MALPEQLKEIVKLKRWVCHKDKIPKNPVTGNNAMANEEDTWATYDEALSGLKRFNFSGIGFQFGLPLNDKDALQTERVTGIDLDHVIHEDGTLEPFAQEIITLMNSYTEISPSGTGIHILCKGKMPDTGRKKYVHIPTSTTKFIIEIYNHSHYFTVTGNPYGETKPIASRTLELKILYDKFFAEHRTQNHVAHVTTPPPSVSRNQIFSKSNPQREYFSADNLSDNQLIERMFSSQNGYDIRSLFSGNTSRYASHSEADFALVSHLAYWTNGDTSRIDALFRQSGLMRDKWNQRHGAQTYGEMTISKVLSNFSPYISSFTPKMNSNTQSNSNENSTPSETTQYSQSSDNINSTGIIQDASPISSRNIHSYIYGIINNWQLKSDLSRFG